MGKRTAIKAFLLGSCAAVFLWVCIAPHGWTVGHEWLGKATLIYVLASGWAGLLAESDKEYTQRRLDQMAVELAKQPWYRFAHDDKDN